MTRQEIPTAAVPSKAKILKATGLALVVAVILLFTTILPAEYGIDPLGTGAAMGLVDLSAPTDETAAEAAPAIPGLTTSPPFLSVPEANSPMRQMFKTDSRDITIEPGTGIEFKYYMDRDTAMLYSWKADGNLFFEFHGDPDVKPTGRYYESYVLDDEEGKTEATGWFKAPKSGVHGWFWENKTTAPITVHLVTAGFYKTGRFYAPTGEQVIELQDAE